MALSQLEGIHVALLLQIMQFSGSWETIDLDSNTVLFSVVLQ